MEETGKKVHKKMCERGVREKVQNRQQLPKDFVIDFVLEVSF
jgi:hypothetical protein